MFKNPVILSTKQSILNKWLKVKPTADKIYFAVKWITRRVIWIVEFMLALTGLILILGFYGNIITFYHPLVSNNAVVFYRSELPHNLTKQESKQITKLKVLSVKINKESNVYANKLDKLNNK
jgi:hypothetical protein